MTFLDININDLKFALDDFVEIEDCFPKQKDILFYKNKLIFLMKKYRKILSQKISNISDIKTLNEAIKCDVICYYLYESYIKSCEELVFDFDYYFNEDEICSLNIEAYVEDIEYPKILKITYSGV